MYCKTCDPRYRENTFVEENKNNKLHREDLIFILAGRQGKKSDERILVCIKDSVLVNIPFSEEIHVLNSIIESTWGLSFSCIKDIHYFKVFLPIIKDFCISLKGYRMKSTFIKPPEGGGSILPQVSELYDKIEGFLIKGLAAQIYAPIVYQKDKKGI